MSENISSNFISNSLFEGIDVQHDLTKLFDMYATPEQIRWRECKKDADSYAGVDNPCGSSTYNQGIDYNFNIVHTPANTIIGYQRQHRKGPNFMPVNEKGQEEADDCTKLTKYAEKVGNIPYKFSQAFASAVVTGMCLVQPKLNYWKDPVDGDLDLKIWNYNEFLMDPYFREDDLSDCGLIWTQRFVSYQQALKIFPEKKEEVKAASHANAHRGSSGYMNRFYFLPEINNLKSSTQLILSEIWYQVSQEKTFFYEIDTGTTFEYSDQPENIKIALEKRKDLFHVFKKQMPVWKVYKILNSRKIEEKINPYGFSECPFVPIIWNRDSENMNYALRVRGFPRVLRTAQLMFNKRMYQNHQLVDATINSGFIYRENSLDDDKALNEGGAGKNIKVKDTDRPLSDIITKTVPTGPSAQEMTMTEQLMNLARGDLSGVSQELFGIGEKGASGILESIRQGAGLIALQKFFDQADLSLKLVFNLERKIIQNCWRIKKIENILNKKASLNFYLGIFSSPLILAEEGMDTPTQQQMQVQQLLELNREVGGIIPPEWLAAKYNIQDKQELLNLLKEQKEAKSQADQQQQAVAQALQQAQLQKYTTSSLADIGLARERHGRAESNTGLFEERISETTRNRSEAIKNQIEALVKLLEVERLYRKDEITEAEKKLQREENQDVIRENIEKADAKITAESTNFLRDYSLT